MSVYISEVVNAPEDTLSTTAAIKDTLIDHLEETMSTTRSVNANRKQFPARTPDLPGMCVYDGILMPIIHNHVHDDIRNFTNSQTYFSRISLINSTRILLIAFSCHVLANWQAQIWLRWGLVCNSQGTLYWIGLMRLGHALVTTSNRFMSM